jgi:hypothetical protein
MNCSHESFFHGVKFMDYFIIACQIHGVDLDGYFVIAINILYAVVHYTTNIVLNR